MEKHFYHWSNGEAGGLFAIECGNTFEYKPMTGSCVREDALISWIGFSEETRWIRDNLKGLVRVNQWRPVGRIGMSGCEDYYISSLHGDVIKRSPKIWHKSMEGKANENICCWVKDLFDLLWTMDYSEDLSEELGITIRDVTDSIENSKKEFLENSKDPQEGWGYEEALVDEDELYK